MNSLYFGAALCLAVGLTVASATVSGQYSVNVHFVPPLVTGACSVAQFWSPSNVTCALCFCMTGQLSRCIPQPGCNPMNNSTTTGRPTTAGPTTVPTTAVTGAQEANHKPTQQQEHVTGKPTAAPEKPETPAEAVTMAPESMNMVRRRRRVHL